MRTYHNLNHNLINSRSHYNQHSQALLLKALHPRTNLLAAMMKPAMTIQPGLFSAKICLTVLGAVIGKSDIAESNLK